jgi:plastocyanin
MRVPKSVLIGAAALMVVAVTGCGDDDGDDASGGLEATATEFEFAPNEWTVAAGDFDLEFTNDGSTDHEWVIMKEPITEEAEFTEEGVLDEVETGAGETVTATFTVDEAGEYQVICGLEGHFDAGMEGTLTVE